ncbi:AraC family transcriptional regulator [Marinibactrum halimedae]|uniref:Transcriptional regulator n=1 Tax=Marinibactrum halimedae TaxID=1444977 RepID=A0AA37WNE7_9GAMM|nr:AraC family transcriptional regulator [Marinibactrum halimedae]MCD9459420.1 AraC family transcriptional regulator [Marinibactrum halimedae]GLS27513.1 transcriptional regulator [Marinibactrum halimedae]
MTVDTTSVPSEYARSLIQSAQAHGCDVEQLLADLDIEPEEIENRLHFSAIKYGKLYQRVMLLTQDECFGMFSGGQVKLGSFRLMCLTVLHCRNLRESILRSGSFADICRGFKVKAHLAEDDYIARVKMGPIHGLAHNEFDSMLSEGNPHQIRTSLAVWHRFNCWLIGQEIPLELLSFTFSCPEDFKVLAESYPAQLKFNQPFNGFEFPARFLDYPVVQNQETLMDFLRSAPYHLVISDSLKSSIKAKVRAILSKDVSENMPTAEEVASRLNLSVTTLRRHLQNEGTSYQKLKDECRMEAAFHYLSCPDFTNTTIAERLGFDESSAFFRAFKKWTGVTPGEYRKQLTNR